MPSPEEFRTFARQCLRWAAKANDIEHREILMNMATHWAEAAACLDFSSTLLDQYQDLANKAEENLSAAGERARESERERERDDGWQPR